MAVRYRVRLVVVVPPEFRSCNGRYPKCSRDVVGLCAVLAVAIASADASSEKGRGPRPVDLSSVTQNWDKLLPTDTRFVILEAFGGQAVRDDETGLVWEQSPHASVGSRDRSHTYPKPSAGAEFGELTARHRPRSLSLSYLPGQPEPPCSASQFRPVRTDLMATKIDAPRRRIL